jgi:hypothetical protein
MGGPHKERALAEHEMRLALEIDRRIGARVQEARVLFELADLLDELDDRARADAVRAEAASLRSTLALDWLPLTSPVPSRVAAAG